MSENQKHTYKVSLPIGHTHEVVADGFMVMDESSGSVRFTNFDGTQTPTDVAFFSKTTSVILQSEEVDKGMEAPLKEKS